MKSTRRQYLQAAAAMAASSALPTRGAAQSGVPADGKPAPRGPLMLSSWGSFHVGGRDFVVTGQPVREAEAA